MKDTRCWYSKTKFGVSLRDEITLTISKERFEDFIAPFLNDDEYELANPQEKVI